MELIGKNLKKDEKMKNEFKFNLSEKEKKAGQVIIDNDLGASNLVYPKEDVKEFIKRLKDKIYSASDMETTTIEQIRAFDFCLEEIDKLAGEKLI